MTSVPFNKAEYYRRRAADVRALAADFINPDLRALMTQMAQEYDELAARSESERASGVPQWTSTEMFGRA